MKPKKTAAKAKKISASLEPVADAPSTTRKVTRTRKVAATDAGPAPIEGAGAKPVAKRKTTVQAAPITATDIPKAPEKPKVARRATPVKLPSILLEGDQPGAPLVSGPGEKFALGPTPPLQQFAAAAELPESYGTKRLFLTARDPHWLYANWDLTREQQSGFNKQSSDGHLVLRVSIAGTGDGASPLEVHVHPESRHWFIHVERAGAQYTAELGYYDKARKWHSIATSGATITPAETISEQALVEFSTLPVDIPFEQLLNIVKEAVRTHQPLARAIEELRREGHPRLPSVKIAESSATPWTTGQERALAEVVTVDEVRRVWIGSLEVTELVRRQLEREISSITAAQLGLAPLPPGAGEAVSSVSSPFGGERPAAKGFWFNINAELIIYGATERDATVTIGGRKIKLRPDGSFSYRFSLPDGRYDLPVVAVSADETDGRAAELKFTRETEIRGDVGAHPQDPALNPPTPENV